MNSAPSASQYHERDFVSVPEWPTPSASNIQNWPKPGASNIQNTQRRLSIVRRMFRALARFTIVFLLGVGAALAAAVVTAQLVQQLKPMALDLAIVRRSVEQLGAKVEELAAKQNQLSHSIVLQSVEQGQKLSSPPQPRVVPPRKPTQPTGQ